MGGLVEYAIHQFYAWRIYQFSWGQVYIPSIIVVTSFSELAFGTAFFVQSLRYPNFRQGADQMTIVISGLSFKLTCDLTITASMVYYLRTQCTKVKQTMDTITTLTLFSIITGALALVFSMFCLIAYVRWPHTLIFASSFITGVRVYVCAFMAQLNSRDRIRTRFAAKAKKGIMFNPPLFTTRQNSSKDGTRGSSSIIIDIVAGFTDENTVEFSSEESFAEVSEESTLPRAV